MSCVLLRITKLNFSFLKITELYFSKFKHKTEMKCNYFKFLLVLRVMCRNILRIYYISSVRMYIVFGNNNLNSNILYYE